MTILERRLERYGRACIREVRPTRLLSTEPSESSRTYLQSIPVPENPPHHIILSGAKGAKGPNEGAPTTNHHLPHQPHQILRLPQPGQPEQPPHTRITACTTVKSIPPKKGRECHTPFPSSSTGSSPSSPPPPPALSTKTANAMTTSPASKTTMSRKKPAPSTNGAKVTTTMARMIITIRQRWRHSQLRLERRMPALRRYHQVCWNHYGHASKNDGKDLPPEGYVPPSEE
ncbi:hypothetical protein Tdes44962_MAKER04231 [Teratosphaeria destructans]|uniref:Uncharacterized protein n=1 Tax=Teratosphaeria destructans TaxID=418781 RepID=A0A9W7SMN2_9PEZI|nr:hypothetical protein Tdes44962_MAKER04231 [Teratosphaeria destructans]